MNNEIETARAQLLGQELGLTRPCLPDEGLLVPGGVWVVVGQRADGRCGIGIVEVEECPGSELSAELADWAAEHLEAVVGHARHDEGSVLYFGSSDHMVELGEYIARHQATLNEEGAE